MRSARSASSTSRVKLAEALPLSRFVGYYVYMPAIHAAKARVERSRRGGWCTSRCARLCKPHLRKQQGGLSDLVWIMTIKHPSRALRYSPSSDPTSIIAAGNASDVSCLSA
jgi:hypothetical protein